MAQVIVFLGNQRETIKVTPATALTEIVAEFARRKGIDGSQYGLRRSDKPTAPPLDMALSWRLSGLSSGVSLDLVRRAVGRQVNVGLQLPDGTRLQGNFVAETMLLEIVLHVEATAKLSLLDTVDRAGVYQQVVVTFLNKQISTLSDLASTSLAALGLDGGSGLLRVTLQPATAGLTQAVARTQLAELLVALHARKAAAQERATAEQQERALANAAQQSQRDAEAAVQAQRMAVLDAENQQASRDAALLREARERDMEAMRAASTAAAAAAAPTPMDATPAEPPAAPVSAYVKPPSPRPIASTNLPASAFQSYSFTLGEVDHPSQIASRLRNVDGPTPDKLTSVPTEALDRAIKCLSPSSQPFDPRAYELPDMPDSGPTAEELGAAIRADAQRKQREEDEAVMKTKLVREVEYQKRMARYKKCVLRVRFPDRYDVEITCWSQETPAHVYPLLRPYLAHDLPFYFYTTPPRQKLDADCTLLKSKLVPAAIVYFSWDVAPGTAPPTDYLRADFKATASEATPPSSLSSSLVSSAPAASPAAAASATTSTSSSAPRTGGSGGSNKAAGTTGGSSGLPKWFKK